MPTPSDSTDALPLERERSLRTTCPPDDDRSGQWRVEVLNRLDRTVVDSSFSGGESAQLQNSSSEAASPEPFDAIQERSKNRTGEYGTLIEPAESTPPMIGASPSTSHSDEKEIEQFDHPTALTSSALDLQYSTRHGIGSTRVRRLLYSILQVSANSIQLIQTHSSSMLRAGSKFRGTQQSDSQKYSVEVDIKTVDMSESFICGYLRIEGSQPTFPPPRTSLNTQQASPPNTQP